MILEIPMRPFAAVRVNWKWWRFMPKAIEYHNKCKALRAIILPHRQEIIDAMILGNYHIQFHFAMAESWSNKKKKEMDHKPMQQKPDNDNLFKAFVDTVFYEQEHNDCEIWNNSYSKYWGKEDKIVFISD